MDKCRGDTHTPSHWRLIKKRQEAPGTEGVRTVRACFCMGAYRSGFIEAKKINKWRGASRGEGDL